MCYNEFEGVKAKKCKVNITSSGDGWNDNVSSYGEIIFSDAAAVIDYTIDGDKCTLVYRNGYVEQRRRGAQNLLIKFSQSKKTLCEIGSDGLAGSYEIITKNVKYLSGKGGVKLVLEYGSGADAENITLVMTAALA